MMTRPTTVESPGFRAMGGVGTIAGPTKGRLTMRDWWLTGACRIGAAVAIAAAVVGISSVAHADDAVVKLKNGDMARGVLVELTRGDHVTIQLPSGESRTYAWADVESVSPVAPSVPPPPPPAAPPPVETGAVVHLVADDEEARLSKLAGTGETTEQIGTSMVQVEVEIYDSLCRAPCDKRIKPGLYRIAGKGLLPSNDFEVPSSGAITVNAHMAGKGRLGGGRMALFIGIPLMIAGGSLLIFSAIVLKPPPSDTSLDIRPIFYGMGGALLGLGAIGVGLGIYFLATAHSDATVTALPQGNSVQSFIYRGMTLTF